jgi:hypothetical protein
MTIAHVTETRFELCAPDMPTRIRFALVEWALAHGLDPHRIPQHEPIVRDVERCRVLCTYIEMLDDGKRLLDEEARAAGRAEYVTVQHVAQGETPPAPWPDVVLALAEGHS